MATPRVLNVAGGQQVYNKEKIDEIVEQLAGDIDPATLASNVMERLDSMDQAIADTNQATSGRLDAMEQSITDANQATSERLDTMDQTTSGRLDTMEQTIADANQATSGRLDAMDQTIADALSGSMPSASDSDIDDIWGN